MDETLKFYDMCAMSHEIQNQWKFKRGDVFTTEKQIIRKIGPSIVDDFWLKDQLTKDVIKNGFYVPWKWLPKQDQLQDMLLDQIKIIHKDSFGYKMGRYPEGYICLCLMSDFETFIDSEYQYIDYIGFDSMEQLWLIFVMDT